MKCLIIAAGKGSRLRQKGVCEGALWEIKGDFDQALADAKKALSLKATNKLFQSFVAELESEIKRKK